MRLPLRDKKGLHTVFGRVRHAVHSMPLEEDRVAHSVWQSKAVYSMPLREENVAQ